VQVSTITPAGVLLQDGRLLPSACIFLEGEVLLWDVPPMLWNGWDESKFEVFDVVVPKPGAYYLPFSQPIPPRGRLNHTDRLSFTRNFAGWYRKIGQTPTSRLATVSQQAGHSSRRHGLGEDVSLFWPTL
jgi:hypothetical protein